MSAAGFAELDGEEVAAADVASLALSGYGCFTTLLCEDGRTRGLDLHLERLRSDSVQLFGRPPAPAPRISVLVTTRAAGAGSARGEDGLRLTGVRHQRDLPTVKHTGLLGPLHHRRTARLAGFDDPVFLGAAGEVLEGPTWNVGFCSPTAQVVWPTGPRLEGVTMALLQAAVPGSRRTGVSWPHLRRSAEGWTAFVTSAGTGVRPVASIDGVALDARPERVERLQRSYAALPAQEV